MVGYRDFNLTGYNSWLVYIHAEWWFFGFHIWQDLFGNIFLGILRYEVKLRTWFKWNLCRGIWVYVFGGFRGCSNFSGICRVIHSWLVHRQNGRSLGILFDRIQFVSYICFVREFYTSRMVLNVRHELIRSWLVYRQNGVLCVSRTR